ncbi:MAG: hypothetical protein DI535_14125 [Citrobacter freundii]|nr:MAG: hypothetical protein DI535_14125 [Citrobacter freundii]
MPYAYIPLKHDHSILHSYTWAMIVLDNHHSFELLHNFPASGKMQIERLLSEWVLTGAKGHAEGFCQFVRRWRDRRNRWGIKNKHLWDCFAIPVQQSTIVQKNRPYSHGAEWWEERF